MKKRFIHHLLLVIGFNALAQNKIPLVYGNSTVIGQPSNELIQYAYDNDVNTMYHSRYTVSGVPNVLEFYLPDVKNQVTSLKYIPRKSQLNGVFTKVKISYSTKNSPSQFVTMPGGNDGIFTFALSNDAKIVTLPNSVSDVAIVKIEVISAYNNFTSCAEFEVYGTYEKIPTICD